MKRRITVNLILIMAMCLILVGCTGSGPPTPPVDKEKDLEQLVEQDMTLEQVYALMTTDLKGMTALYPAMEIEQQVGGQWLFIPEQEEVSTTEDSSYHALIVPPAQSGDKYYLVFFKDGSVIGSDWFSSAHAAVIKQILGDTSDNE